MKQDIPNVIIDRAVDLWCLALHAPRFANGDSSFAGAIGLGLASMIAEKDREKVEDYKAAIERFRHALAKRLKFLRDNDGKPRPPEDIERDRKAGKDYVPDHYHLDVFLSVDYHPDTDLREAAAEAGVPESAFSIKSSVSIWPTHVTAHFGYGADHVHHYPLPDGRWLLTSLSGSEMPKVIEYVMGGKPEFRVDSVDPERNSDNA